MNKKTLVLYTIVVVIVTAIVTHSIVRLGGSGVGYAELNEAYNVLSEEYYEYFDHDVAIEGAIRGMAEALGDPYTSYMNAEEYSKFEESITGMYSGIGVIFSGNEEDDCVTVVSPIDGTPAARAGLASGDKLLFVDGVAVTSTKLDDASSRMRGQAGTKVVITVLKVGETQAIDIELTRENITLETVRSEMFGNVGYIRISSFEENTASDFNTHLENVLNKGATGLILDLRGNPGGLVNSAIDIADEFLSSGVIVYTENKRGEQDFETADEESVDIPLVLLIDEGSASSSEILTGALKDNERARVIGEKTFGKGIIQGLFTLSDGGRIKVTIAKYFTPNGSDINKVGIEPDELIEDEQDQLNRALELLK
ncbi:MAG: PDZ domain-containing protein [Clostridiales bacterium]|jgi:carboxyl-terminal processing protease|nr:PDZ domain-containing protein [Clostridiales bacterium]